MKRLHTLLPIIFLLLSSSLANGQKRTSPSGTKITPLAPGKMKFRPYWSIALTLGNGFCAGENCTADTDDSLSDLTFDFSASFHLIPYWAVGISVGVAGLTNSGNEQVTDREISHITTVMLENRIYFHFADAFHPFGLLAIVTVKYNYKELGPDGETKSSEDGFGFRIGGGIDYSINPDYSIGAVFSYEAQYLRDVEEPADAGSTYEIHVFRAGIRFIVRF